MHRIRTLALLLGLACGLVFVYAAAPRSTASSAVLEQMRRRDPQAFAFAQAKGARIEPVSTALGTSFYLAWFPKGKKPQSTPVIVTLHGSRGDAAVKFQSWQPEAAKRGYGVIALEWWNGVGRPAHGPESEVNYLSAAQLYSTLRSILAKEEVKPGLALLHGHSRGGARTYPVTYLDRKSSRFFRLSVGDSGGANPDSEDIQKITSLAGARFVLYCGERDRGNEIPACDALELTKTWLESKGAKVELFIKDPAGNHGGFLASPANIDKALDVFARLLRPTA
jgi:hypothetical protein